MLNTSRQWLSDVASQNVSTVPGDLNTDVQNDFVPEGCIKFRFSELEFFPWNNSDNIVTEKVEIKTRKIRFCMLQILFVIGGPANIINMVIFFTQGLRDRVNLLLFSLSLADELTLITATVTFVEEYYIEFAEETKTGPFLAFVVNNHLLFLHGVSFVSLILSAVIACERCYCVLRPLKYQTLMKTKTMAFVIIAVYVVVLGLCFIAGFRYYSPCVYDPDSGIVTHLLSFSEVYITHKDVIDSVDNILFGAGLPVGMTIVVISTTVITISKLRQTIAWRTETSSSLSPREVALTKMLIGTSILLIICISPAGVFRVACLFLPEMNTGRRNQNMYLTCLWITEIFLYINSTFNVFIYYVMGSRYRETFWNICQKKRSDRKKQKELM